MPYTKAEVKEKYEKLCKVYPEGSKLALWQETQVTTIDGSEAVTLYPRTVVRVIVPAMFVETTEDNYYSSFYILVETIYRRRDEKPIRGMLRV